MKEWLGIGLMSGTSLDGLDICYVKITLNHKYSFNILNANTLPYTQDWIDKLTFAYTCPINDLTAIDNEYGLFLAEATQDFIQKNTITKLDFVASHGHTVRHQPKKGITIQIGNGMQLFSLLQKPIIYDFRSQDVALGGQGAPLVPIGDDLLFSDYDACINLGGFANISFKKNNQRIAFDICPTNIVLNKYATKLGFEYDNKGNLAEKGNLNLPILNTLNKLNYYTLPPPKSLGLEWVEDNIFPILDDLPPLDALHTFTHHIAQQLQQVLSKNKLKNVLCTGGGTYNNYLLKTINSNPLFIPTNAVINYKEALIFAFMGVLKLENKINIYQSVTGASKDHCGGTLIN